jgi:uncharacterized membrane protein
MRLRPLFLTLLLVAAAFSLGRVLVTRSHVGPVEYVVGIALLAVLVLGVVSASRQIRRA